MRWAMQEISDGACAVEEGQVKGVAAAHTPKRISRLQHMYTSMHACMHGLHVHKHVHMVHMPACTHVLHEHICTRGLHVHKHAPMVHMPACAHVLHEHKYARVACMYTNMHPWSTCLHVRMFYMNTNMHAWPACTQTCTCGLLREQANQAPGWLQAINTSSAAERAGHMAATKSETEEYGVTSFVYRARRPFHPGRLYRSFMRKFFLTQARMPPVCVLAYSHCLSRVPAPFSLLDHPMHGALGYDSV